MSNYEVSDKAALVGIGTWSDQRLNARLAELLGELEPVPEGCETEVVGDVLHYLDERRTLHACHENYCENWDVLMPLALEWGVYVLPTPKLDGVTYEYRSGYMPIKAEGVLAFKDPQLNTRGDDPARCLVMTLIKVFASTPSLLAASQAGDSHD